MKMEPLIFEQSAEGRCAMSIPVCDVPEVDLDTILPSQLLRDSKPELPQLAEVDLVRHFTRLSSFNHGVF